MKKITLAVIDAQTDFCVPTGSLFVPGSVEDCQRTANLINRLSKKITEITCTLDSHNMLHIADSTFWKDRNGNNPPPFTLITDTDVESGIWRAARPSLQSWALKYTKTLKKNARFSLTIWPKHCKIGSAGASVELTVFEALKNWSEQNFGFISWVTKGSNVLTEHYGALEADVPLSDDPSTQLNVDFVKNLEESDLVLLCGQAKNFCVKNTLEQVVNNLSDISYAKKIKILSDCTSSIKGFDKLDQDFDAFCQKNGIEVVTSVDFLA